MRTRPSCWDQDGANKPTSRAVSARSSSAPCLKMLTGAIDKDTCKDKQSHCPLHNNQRSHWHDCSNTGEC